MSPSTKSWDNFLNPKKLKQNLISASVFLAAYEMMRQALIDQVRGFYSMAMDANGEWEICDEYKHKVLSLDKKEIVACAKWFREMKALGEDDLILLKELADHRNIIAHELPAIIGSKKEVSILHLRCIYAITAKIDNWWIREIEIPTNPDFEAGSLSEEQLAAAYSMRMMTMSMLIEIAEGDDSNMETLYEAWKKHHKAQDGNTEKAS